MLQALSISREQRLQETAMTPVFPPDPGRCSAVVLSMNGGGMTRRCVESVLQNAGPGLAELILVDNGSDDPRELEWAREFSGVRLIRSDRNLGFAGGCNLGIESAAPGNSIWLLNNDTLVFPGALDALLSAFRDERVGAAGSISNHVRAAQKIYPAIRSYEELEAYYKRMPKSVQACRGEMRLSGFSMLIRNEALSQVGLLDTAFYPGGYEDDDYCLRLLEKGWRLTVCTGSLVYHHGSHTMKQAAPVSEILLRNRAVFEAKWGASEDELFDDSRYYFLPAEAPWPRRALEIGTHGGAWLASVLGRFPGSSVTAVLRRPETKRFLAPEIRCADSLRELEGVFDVIFCTDLPAETYDKTFFSSLNRLLAENGVVYCRGPAEEYGETLRAEKLPGWSLPALDPGAVEAVCREAGFVVSALYRFTKQKDGAELSLAIQMGLKKGGG